MAFEQWDKPAPTPMPPKQIPADIAGNQLKFQKVRDMRRENERQNDIRSTMENYFASTDEPTNKGMGDALSKRGHTDEAYKYGMLDQQRRSKSGRRKILPQRQGDGMTQDYSEDADGNLSPWGKPYKSKKTGIKGSVAGSATEKEVVGANGFLNKYYGEQIGNLEEESGFALDQQVANGARYLQRRAKDNGETLDWTVAMDQAAKHLMRYVDPGKETSWLDFELDEKGTFNPPMGASNEDLYNNDNQGNGNQGNGNQEEDLSGLSWDELSEKAIQRDRENQ